MINVWVLWLYLFDFGIWVSICFVCIFLLDLVLLQGICVNLVLDSQGLDVIDAYLMLLRKSFYLF